MSADTQQIILPTQMPDSFNTGSLLISISYEPPNSQNANTTRLPREIFLQIIDYFIQELDDSWTRYLESDPFVAKRPVSEKTPLLTLSTVSKYFRAYLLPVLFRRLQFHGPNHLYQHKLEYREMGYRHFMRELVERRATAVELMSLVEECVFSGWQSILVSERLELAQASELYIRALELMPNLKTIRFNSVLLNFSTISTVIRQHPSLLTLTLGHIGVLSMNQPTTIDRSGVAELVAALHSSSIVTLTMDAHSLAGLASFSRSWDRPFTSLTSLRVNSFTGDVSEFFEFLPMIPSVTTLIIAMYWHRQPATHFPSIPSTSLPLLHTLACPLQWAAHLVPGRPLRHVELRHPVYSEAPETYPLQRVVLALSQSSDRLERLLIPHQIALEDWSALKLGEVKSLVVETDEFSFGSFVGSERNALRTFDQILDRVAQTRARDSRAFLGLERFMMPLIHRQLDLPYQRDFLSRLTPSFPEARHVQLSTYLWWIREDGEWKPKLGQEHLDIVVADGGRRFAEQRDRKEGVVDYQGFFEGLGVLQ